jgi:cytochrome c
MSYSLVLRSLKQFLAIALLFGLFCNIKNKETRILIFSKTAGFRHESIEAGIGAIKQLGLQHHFIADTTENPSAFHKDNLKRYDAVIFLNTTGDVLNNEQQNNFEHFIQAGGGYVGIHAASDTEHDWAWYGKLAGACFAGHPSNPNVQKGMFYVLDKKHPATQAIPERWERTDEFYNFRQINPEINILIGIDEKSYSGGTNGDNHPMSWYHEFDGGRSFYTNMGHTVETFSEPLFLKHLWGGIKYAADIK